ncbi:hypothetical protein GCM10017687_55820 [Streptomyces echinatus]
MDRAQIAALSPALPPPMKFVSGINQTLEGQGLLADREAIDPRLPGLKTETFIQPVRRLTIRPGREVHRSGTRLMSEPQSLLSKKARDPAATRGTIYDYVFDPASQPRRQRRQHKGQTAHDRFGRPRDEHVVRVALDQPVDRLVVEGLGSRRELRK